MLTRLGTKWLTLVLALWVFLPLVATAQTSKRAPMDGIKSIFGLAADPTESGGIFLATEFGLLRATPDGMAEKRPEPAGIAVTGLADTPDDSRTLFLSGLLPDGTSAGILISHDAGATWAEIPGTKGRTDVPMTSLDVAYGSQKLVGLNRVILKSENGGETWISAGQTPAKTFSVAISDKYKGRLYAATMQGLMLSTDGGNSWSKTFPSDSPATAVSVLRDGRVIAFIYATGVVVADEAALDWKATADGFADRYLVRFAEGPNAEIYAIADTGAILLSRNGAKDWISFEGSDNATPERIAAGKALYVENCQTCHGVGGVGEAPGNPEARDSFGFKAPALNNDMHAWHHSDQGLFATISQGSPRNSRMIAWQDSLSRQEIQSIIAYLKSTWSIRSLACQGARHMTCLGN